MTNDLEAVTWVSPDFFAARYPEHAARGAIYYLGMALVAPQRGQFRLLERVVRQLAAACVAGHGVLAYDVCAFNDSTVSFGRRAEAALGGSHLCRWTWPIPRPTTRPASTDRAASRPD